MSLILLATTAPRRRATRAWRQRQHPGPPTDWKLDWRENHDLKIGDEQKIGATGGRR